MSPSVTSLPSISLVLRREGILSSNDLPGNYVRLFYFSSFHHFRLNLNDLALYKKMDEVELQTL